MDGLCHQRFVPSMANSIGCRSAEEAECILLLTLEKIHSHIENNQKNWKQIDKLVCKVKNKLQKNSVLCQVYGTWGRCWQKDSKPCTQNWELEALAFIYFWPILERMVSTISM